MRNLNISSSSTYHGLPLPSHISSEWYWMWWGSKVVSNIPKPKHLLNLDLDREFLLPAPLSIINTEYWAAVKLDLAEIENILFSIKHLLYKYKVIFSFHWRFSGFSENSKKVSTLFVILKIFVKFPVSLYLTGWYWKYHSKLQPGQNYMIFLNIFPTEKV